MWTKVFLFLHLVCAFSALAVSIHLLVRLIRNRRQPERFRHRIRLHGWTLAGTYLGTFILGLLIYPPFRLDIRHHYLDEAMPWLTGLFEIKEHLAALALLPILFLAVFLRRQFTDGRDPVEHRGLSMLLTGFVTMVLVFGILVGWYLVSVRSL